MSLSRLSILLYSTVLLAISPSISAQSDYRARYGHAEMDISCNVSAHSAFERGLLQLHSFAWEIARESFREAGQRDAQCAMAYWGEAMSYYDGLHEHPSGEEVGAARNALARAMNAETASDRERAYIAAAAEIFKGYPDVPRVVRDRNYYNAITQIVKDYPDDEEARIFQALSMLSLARRGEDASLLTQAAEILEPLFEQLPEHPGVAHYLIHAYDDSGNREPGIEAARRYAGIAPLMTHAQHMPAHIFAGIGMWPESNASNEGALEADPGYYHALMYLVYGNLQLGKWQQAEMLVNDLRELALSDQGGRAERRGLHSSNTWLLLETRDWERAAQVPAYSDASLDIAETLYVRGVGGARSGNLAAANEALRSLQDLVAKLNEINDSGIAVRAKLTEIQAKQVEALIALANKETDKALALMREATSIEDGPGVERAPPDSGTGLPAHEVMGEILIELGRYPEAQEHFRAALRRTPNRLHSIAGLARAAAMAGDKATAVEEYNHLLELLSSADGDLPVLIEARVYLENEM